MRENQQLLNKFPTTGVKGNAGEKFLYNLFLNRYDKVSDYRFNSTAQSTGFDFGIKQNNWPREITLDVKNNLYVTPEKVGFKIEITKNNKPGWFLTSKADRIYHCSYYHKNFMYYELGDLRYYIFNTMRYSSENIEFLYYNDNKDLLIQLYWTKNLPISEIYNVT